ncbi:cytochrome ubiquinol oxidase subunit I [Tengunoibacter tsumagoiensis]|uniref:Cytochrome ubiquinol oxidase subunit I n=1 Tax=Tengunoibacter tsumagoiensis TaxID=2014871 RepID=A0A401ZW91_9CHLR|nr:cytochrome ubiquinol oxidase subunit I [Tengunoibacter tsumagoiensis]GCE11153.1 cytochrome ubiquinol oxidase subunit I [Tengunoibacter tsumagoiensis]
MPTLLAARAQMGTSLAFHIVFSVLGVGLPLLLCIAEGLALYRKDAVLMTLARRWAKAAVIIFAIGAVSGTIVEFELGLLWPTYIQFIGAVIGPLFAFEGFAFFLEAIFFGIYLYAWDYLSPRTHWLCSFPIWIGGLASTWFIVTANAWMNTPTGFEYTNGKLTGIDSLAAIANPSTPYQTVHMALACYAACGFGVAAVYAIALLRGKRDDYHRKALLLGLVMASVAIPLQIISGDFNARYLSTAQPAKLAAMEGVFLTGRHVPLNIGGLADPKTEKVYYSIPIPDGLSLMVDYNPDGEIRGLDSFPPEDRPNPLPVHLSFDGMVGSGFFALFIAILFWFLYYRRKRVIPEQKWMLVGIALAGFLSFVAVELGWMVTEWGRQPWTIYNYLRTSQAVTTAPFLNISFLIFSCIYVVLAITMTTLLLRLGRKPFPEMVWSNVAAGRQATPRSEEEELKLSL